MHSICPYFAMFPEDFVAKQLLAYTQRGDIVFDPFCGRGTTVFESLLNGRRASGVDINPVAACIAGAKADAPKLGSVQTRLAE
ncbi:MAG: DNA methyltransferase, partial [Gammaproteobacteria bacterium]|nr:DNA methyltransferase [Gammaproteobacteria bacterium]